MDIGVILRRFESPDEVREMTLGRFEVIRLGGRQSAARPTSRGGSGQRTSAQSWGQRAAASSTSGSSCRALRRRHSTTAGSSSFGRGLFYIPPEPHDSWVVGTEPYVSLHFLGAEKYAAR